MASIRDFGGNGALWSLINDRDRTEQRLDQIRQMPPAFVPNTGAGGLPGLLSGIASIVAARRREGQLQGSLDDNFRQIFQEQERMTQRQIETEQRKRQQEWEDWQRRETEKARIERENRPAPTASGSDFKVIERPDGVYRMNLLTGAAEKVQGLPGVPGAGQRQDTAADFRLIERADGVYRVNMRTGQSEKVSDVPGQQPSGPSPNDKALLDADAAALKSVRDQERQSAPLAEDALRFISTTTGRKLDDLRQLTPEQAVKVFKDESSWVAGPHANLIPFSGIATESITESAAAKLAKLNNPTGPVSTPDTEAARKAIFSIGKPDAVNASILLDALSRPGNYRQQAAEIEGRLRGGGGSAAPSRAAGPGSSRDNPVVLTSPDQIKAIPKGTWIRSLDGSVGQR